MQLPSSHRPQTSFSYNTAILSQLRKLPESGNADRSRWMKAPDSYWFFDNLRKAFFRNLMFVAAFSGSESLVS
jgi:hypothetical protein